MKKTKVKKRSPKRLLSGKEVLIEMQKISFKSGIKDSVALIKKWR